MKWWLYITLFQCLRVTALMTTPGSQKRCLYHRTHKMYGASCPSLNLQQIPITLQTNIEVLDMTGNRVRELKNGTFTRHSNLKYLYLGDNKIQIIEPLAMEPLTSLEVLDLSFNAIISVPEIVFNMPSLRKLYIQENYLTRLNADLELMKKPFAAPLNFIHMANCKLDEFPDLGILPDLQHLNVSGNTFKSLEPRNLAKLCGLKILDFTGSFEFSNRVCINKPLIDWFVYHEIQAVPELYSIFNPNDEDLKKCAKTPMNENDINMHNECTGLLKMKEKEKSSKKTWIIIASSLGGFLVLAIIFLYCMHRRNGKHSRFTKVNVTEPQHV